ncbi:ATP-dependent DNA helicase [Mycena chlorophos]|uniref:ATP-dependent DNA helicase n=1 Tax=Mycena chlorophos TaxID=658473 RepID=A0A8H6WS26_MYCCL|nr:ATP-dependent DNA helicase [Mycena chlorophos]
MLEDRIENSQQKPVNVCFVLRRPMPPASIEHTPREHHSYPGSLYVMPADDPEKQRLDRQHRLFKDLLNGRILLAPVQLEEGDAVLETGTGTGAWLVELASSVDPSVQMVGVDIEPRLFPVEAPKNISFHMNTVLNLPAEWTNKFTLVHQRLLMVALRTVEWPQALREMHRVLRPGGWVQIAESSTWPVGAYPGRPSMEKLVALMRALLEEQAPSSTDAFAMSIRPLKHIPREHQHFPGSRYILPSDGPEIERLLLQHRSLAKIYDGRLLLAPAELAKGDKVLELGTARGFWMFDLAATVDPSVEFVGVDIEPRMFPSSSPKNISFRVASTLKLPVEWNNTFAVVHQRLLIGSLEVQQWPEAAREIFRVLRPGGWVQLGEPKVWPLGAYPGRPSMKKCVELQRALEKARNLDFECAEKLPKLLADAGFVDVQQEWRMRKFGSWAGDIGLAWKENQVSFFRGIKTPIMEAGGYGVVASEAEYDALVDGLERELDDLQLAFVVCWARKPVAKT